MDRIGLYTHHLVAAYQKLAKNETCFLVNGDSCHILEINTVGPQSSCIFVRFLVIAPETLWLYYSESGACWHDGEAELPCVVYPKSQLDVILGEWLHKDLRGVVYGYLPLSKADG